MLKKFFLFTAVILCSMSMSAAMTTWVVTTETPVTAIAPKDGVDPSATAVEYTVKFVDQEGNSIKDAVTYEGEPGAPISVSDGDKVNIVNNGVTYLYVSDDAEGKTIANDGSTVVTLTFRVGKKWNYTVNEVYGDITFRTTVGSAFEGETVKVPYHKYNAKEGQLYTKDATNEEYNHSFTLSENNQVVNIEYTVTTTYDVQFISEGEDIDGLTVCNSGNTGIRSSNSSSAYAKDGKVKIATLMQGNYKIHAGIYDATSAHDSHWIFLAGNKQIADLNCTVVNLQELESEVFTLEVEEATAIYLAQGGGNSQGLDFVYITGDGGLVNVESEEITIGSAGYATLYYENENLEVPAGVTATTYTLEGKSLKEYKVYEVGDVIPSGEAVVLNGNAGTYKFDIVSTENVSDENNVLKGTDRVETISEAGYKYYVLSLDANNENIGFYYQNDDGSSVDNGAHKAYLSIATAQAKVCYMLSDEGVATAIESAPATEKYDGIVYDLQGRRVATPTKGLYIVNGRKVVVK